eukprot:Tamp_10702.p1 GENE.Tamp_10702~~Tamp_10702.p1  ORF type:complete len:641 (+),score=109.04 Tamp_10702:161-1924(+)
MYEVPDAPCGGLRPLTIFHAFNWRFHGVKGKLDDLCNAGYDAVQISPCQKSIGEQHWWERYQPISYAHIEGLGSAEELQELCTEAKDRDIMIIADLVFNHMAVVASRDEWARAQYDKGFEQELLGRLDTYFPPLTRDDFHPWKACGPEDWDNENRFHVWGDGQWCDLRATKRVLDLHKQHVDILLGCGVKGFRFDAAKHIHPTTLAHYASYIRAQCPDAYIYFEVLSGDVGMHMSTTHIATSTDFDLCFKVRDMLVHSCDPGRLAELPLLSNDGVRFARNHDTIHNELMALQWGYRSESVLLTMAWVIILALDGGTVLMYSDDADRRVEGGKPMEAVVRFRKEMFRRGAPPHYVFFIPAEEDGAEKAKTSGASASLSFRGAWMVKELDAQSLQNLASTVASAKKKESIVEILASQIEVLERQELQHLASSVPDKKGKEELVEALERHAATLLEQAEEEQRQEEEQMEIERITNEFVNAQNQCQEKEKKRMAGLGHADFAHKGLLCIVRGGEGFVCMNLANSWFDTRRLRFGNTELEGSYTESTYGFDVDITADHVVERWGGDASGEVRIGPHSALVFTRTSVARSSS